MKRVIFSAEGIFRRRNIFANYLESPVLSCLWMMLCICSACVFMPVQAGAMNTAPDVPRTDVKAEEDPADEWLAEFDESDFEEEEIYGPVQQVDEEDEPLFDDSEVLWEDEELMSVNVSNDAKREFVEYIAPFCMADQALTGIPASVTIAQCILESGWGQSGLAKKANNLFGIKAGASVNSWSEYSAWDGVSYVQTRTGEQLADGSHVSIIAKFRAYPSFKESIADHSAYLIHSQKNGKPRYPGIDQCKDYRTAFWIIQLGGYATSHTYADTLCAVVEKYDLTRFDADPSPDEEIEEIETEPVGQAEE